MNAPSVRQIPSRPRAEKPQKTAFFRTRPGADFRLQTAVLEAGEGFRGEAYLLDGDLGDLGPIESSLIPVELRLAVTRDGSVHVWPLRIPASDRPNRWHQTAWHAAELAEKRWVRLVANQTAGEYEIFEAIDDLGDAAFPDEPFGATLHRAFDGRLIDSFDHPVLRKLRGEKT